MTKASHRTVALTAEMPLGEALALIGRQQLAAIERHRPGARRGRDAEELHDLRVAVRRTRTILSEFRRYFPADPWHRFRDEFRWVGKVTGPVRDLDVYLAHLPGYRTRLPADAAAALEPFRRFLLQRRRLEQRRSSRRLDSLRLQRLLHDWREFLENTDAVSWTAETGQAAGETARRHIWKLYCRFIRQGEAIRPGSPDKAFHRLRITGKKLRYQVEFFRECYPAAEVAVLIRSMKGIQDFLGGFQDCTVQQTRLAEIGELMTAEGTVPPETLAALAELVKQLHHDQQRMRRDFRARFRVFRHGRGRRGFVRIFAPPEEPG